MRSDTKLWIAISLVLCGSIGTGARLHAQNELQQVQVIQEAGGLCVFSSDGKMIASRGPRNAVELWDPATGKKIASLAGHTDPIGALAFRPKEKILASASRDKTVRLWDVAKGQEVMSLKQKDAAMSLAFSPDGKTLATGYINGTVQLWDAATGKETALLKGYDPMNLAAQQYSYVYNLGYTANGSLLAIGCEDGAIRLWDYARSDWKGLIHANGRLMAMSPSGGLLAVGAEKKVQLWDVGTQKQAAVLTGFGDVISALAFSPDGKVLVTGDIVGEVRFWNVERRQSYRHVRNQHRGMIGSIAFSPDAKTVASGGYTDGIINVWPVPRP